jgi:pyruvate carboxylase subunit B
MKYFVTLNGRTWTVEIAGSRVTVDGEEHRAELRGLEATPIKLLVLDGRTWSVPMQSRGRGRWTVLAQGEVSEVEVLDERAAHIRSLVGEPAASTGPLVLKAPMPGLVVRVPASQGQKVVEGTSLIVLEAMKMENELKAAGNAVVIEVSVRPGQTVERGQVLVRLAPPE